MSKRFESEATKRKRKKNENDMVKKIKPITAFLHQLLTEATDAGSEVGALTLAQENQCDEADQPTASIQPEESVIKKQCWTLNSNVVMWKQQPCPVKMKIQMYLRTQLLQKEGKKKHMKVVEIVKIFNLSPSVVNQSRGITDTYANDTEHRSRYTKFKERCLWKELSNEEIAYWIERAVLKFSTVVNHSLVPSEGTRSNPGFA